MADSQETLTAKEATFRSIIQESCAMLGSSPSSFAEYLGAGLKNSVINAFRHDSIEAKFHANHTIDGTTLHFAGGTT